MSTDPDDAMMEAVETLREARTLRAARRVRPAAPRVCATCAEGWLGAGVFVCARPDGYTCDIGDEAYWLMTCDSWRPASPARRPMWLRRAEELAAARLAAERERMTR